MINRDAWYQAMPGLMVMAEEKAVIERALKTERRNDLLQIGGPGDARLVENLRATRAFFLDKHHRTEKTNLFIRSEIDLLPIQSETMDIVLLIHALEKSAHPKAILQEAYRVLKPNGKIVVIGFNRWSLWRLFHMFSKKQVFPPVFRFYGMDKIKRILHRLSCDIHLQQTFCFRLPFKKVLTATRWVFLESLGQFIFPSFGAAYFLMATKKVVGVTPLRSETWRKKMRVSANMVEPTV